MSHANLACRRLSVAILLALSSSVALAADAPLPAGVKAVWDMAKAYHDTTPTSERICVNGLWRFQPASANDVASPTGPAAVPAGDWGFFKVPGHWPGANNYMIRDSQTLYPNPAWKVPSSPEVAGWYQREIVVPPSWKDRRVSLSIDYLNSYAAVYLDGVKVGEAYFPAGSVDITSAVRPGAKQLLSLYVKAAPLAAVMMAFNDTGVPKEVKGSIERKGLCGDLFLVSAPKGPRIDDVKVDPSVRNWTVAFNAALADLKPDGKYTLVARVSDAGKPVKDFTSAPFSSADLKDGRFTFSSPWHPDKLWDTNTPQNMYTVDLTLIEAAGQSVGRVDVFRPVRFGFRELWSQGRDFYLNGTRFNAFLVALDNPLIGPAYANYDAARETFLRQRSFGVNLVYSHNYGTVPGSHVSYDEILRAADDTGMLVAFAMPHSGNYDWKAADASLSNGYARTASFYVRVAENHPSVVLYAMNHNSVSYPARENPDLIDGLHDASGQIGPRNDSVALPALAAQAIVESLDPSRIVYHQSGGNLGHSYSINVYLNWTPIQEVSDWFQHWSDKGVMPLIITEYDTPFDTDWTMFRGWYQGARNWGSKPMAWEYCPAEWNSALLGDAAFDLPDSDKENLRWEADNWKKLEGWFRWSYPHAIVGDSTAGNVNKQLVRSMYISDNWRAFRTQRVSAFNEFGASAFWSLRPGLNKKGTRVDFPVDWDSIQRPGFSPDFSISYASMELGFARADWIPGPAAQALYRNNMPLLAYIAGPADRLTSKDHNFLPGQSFEKTVVVINNSRVKLDCDVSWSLALPQPLAGAKTFTIQTGEQERVPVSLALPAGLKPGPYVLSMTAKFSNGESQTDTFTVTVVAPAPAPALPQARPAVALFDPKGDTAKLLTSLNVAFAPVAADADLAPYRILVVGREALSLDGPAPDISRVRQGLRVVMFEQTAPVLEKRFGFRVQEYGLRNVFARVPDHPLLAGLSNANLHDWTGDATLLTPRLVGIVQGLNGDVPYTWCGISVKRTYRCGTAGSVASVLIEKPAKGDFLPLLEGGYSVQYAPLMLYREGAGCMILCQMDVTARSQSDPAASLLVANILSYAANFTPDPARPLVYLGDPVGSDSLKKMGFSPAPYKSAADLAPNAVLVVGPGSAAALGVDAVVLRGWLKTGGRLFALGLSAKDLAAFPFPIKTASAEHISTRFEPLPAKSFLAGVGPADVYNRDPRSFDLVVQDEKPVYERAMAGMQGAAPIGDGVLAHIINTSVVISQMAPWQFDYEKQWAKLPAYNLKRTFRRTSCLTARVLGNMGVSAPTPLLERFSKPAGVDAPWLDAFYLDKPQEMDDPYRYFRW